jgi:cbb3-type cytochrome oxidase maturation protein
MDIIYLLLPIALILVVLMVLVFFWAVKSDQFDDLEGPAHRILMDDDKPYVDKHIAIDASVNATANNDTSK